MTIYARTAPGMRSCCPAHAPPSTFLASQLLLSADYRRQQRVVVSLTSTPSRLPYITLALQSLMAQSRLPDAIYLNIPRPAGSWSAWLPCNGTLDCTWSATFRGVEGSVAVPAFLAAGLASLPQPQASLLRVNWVTEDVGPATKLLPTLHVERTPDTLIVTVDDDVHYHPDVVAELVNASQLGPHAAYGFAGQQVEPRTGGGYAVLSVDTPQYHQAPNGVGVRLPRPLLPFELCKNCAVCDDGHVFAHICTHRYLGGLPWCGVPARFL